MKHHFLCPNHRQELINTPQSALRSWTNTNEAGVCLAGVGQHYDALPHLGCAFEVAEIILTGNFVDQDKAVSLLTTSAVMLANSLKVLGYEEQRLSVLQLTLNRLNKIQNVDALFSEQLEHVESELDIHKTLH